MRLTGRQKVRARKKAARDRLDAIAAFVARTGAPLVDKDAYVAAMQSEIEFRARVNVLRAFQTEGERPWRKSP